MNRFLDLSTTHELSRVYEAFVQFNEDLSSVRGDGSLWAEITVMKDDEPFARLYFLDGTPYIDPLVDVFDEAT